ERAISLLPKNLIHNIKKKTVYLNLSKKEFEEWWKSCVSEYVDPGDLDSIKKEISVSFDENFGSEVILTLLRDKKCAFCGSSVTGKERLYCRSCKTFFMKDDLGKITIPNEQREKLCDDQLKIRRFFSKYLRSMLHFDEWIYLCISEQGSPPHPPSLDEDVLLVTSKRVIRYRADGSKVNNWKIPIDDILSVSATRKVPSVYDHNHYYRRGLHPLLAYFRRTRRIYRLLHRPLRPRAYLHFRFYYETSKGSRQTLALFPLYRSGKRILLGKTEAVGRWVERIKELRRIKAAYNI
ncbi:MAG: hypothetical protein ACFE7E_05850, partial [Candidatus Hodarchaeota archaeon]